jgi:hypothetical protein
MFAKKTRFGAFFCFGMPNSDFLFPADRRKAPERCMLRVGSLRNRAGETS